MITATVEYPPPAPPPPPVMVTLTMPYRVAEVLRFTCNNMGQLGDGSREAVKNDLLNVADALVRAGVTRGPDIL